MSRTPYAVLLSTFLLTLATAACAPRADEAEPETEPDQVYTVRGEIVGLPQGAGDLRQIRVRHESVPEFVDAEGEVVGMASMTMPFPVAERVDLDGLETGDEVELTFEVRWEGGSPLRVVALEELPDGTVLDFETPEPMPGDAVPEGVGSSPP